MKTLKLLTPICLAIIALYLFNFNQNFNLTGNDSFYRSIVYDSLTYINKENLESYYKDIFKMKPLEIITNYIYIDIKNLKLKIDNNLGILIYYNIFQKSLATIFIFQLILYLYGIRLICKLISNERKIIFFYILIICNIYILGSLSPLNKEILGFLSFFYLIIYRLKKNIFFLIIAILMAFFCRGQVFLLILFYFIFEIIIKKFELNSKIISVIYIFIICVLLIYITINYQYISHNELNILIQGRNSLGITKLIDQYNMNYNIHYLTIIIKIFGNYFGGLIKPINTENLEYIFNYLSQIYFFILISILIFKKKDYLFSSEFFILIIYSIIFSSHSFIHHRYMIPTSIILIYFILFQSKKVITSDYRN